MGQLHQYDGKRHFGASTTESSGRYPMSGRLQALQDFGKPLFLFGRG